MVTPTPDHEIHARTQAGEPVVDDDGQTARVWTTTRLSLLCDTDEETVWEHETTEGPKIQSGWRYGIPFSHVLDGSSAVRVGDNVARAYVASTERQWRQHQRRAVQALHLTLKRITAGVDKTWVLNELAGMSFPEQDGAYDYMKARIRSPEDRLTDAGKIYEELEHDASQLADAMYDMEHAPAPPQPEGNSVFFERLLESATPPEFALAIGPESES